MIVKDICYHETVIAGKLPKTIFLVFFVFFVSTAHMRTSARCRLPLQFLSSSLFV